MKDIKLERYVEIQAGGVVYLHDNPPNERDNSNNIFRGVSISDILTPLDGRKILITISEIE